MRSQLVERRKPCSSAILSVRRAHILVTLACCLLGSITTTEAFTSRTASTTATTTTAHTRISRLNVATKRSRLYVAGIREEVEAASKDELPSNNNNQANTASANTNTNTNNSDAPCPSQPSSAAVDALQEQHAEIDQTSSLFQKIQEKMGTVEDDRYLFPEYNSGEIPSMFSSLKYTKKSEDGNDVNSKMTAVHAAGSVVGAAALVASTTIGAGVLALPEATVNVGFLPSTVAMLVGYGYMTVSGLLIAELSLNRMAATGKLGTGLLDLYEPALGQTAASIGKSAYFLLHYAMMVAFMAQGGINLSAALPGLQDNGAAGPAVFAAVMATALFTVNKGAIEKVNTVFMVAVFGTFAAILAVGTGTADFACLINPINQHPETIVDTFPVIFTAFIYQNVVPDIVKDLEGDRSKIQKAIIAGTTIPLLMFLAWNAIVLGNLPPGSDLSMVDPVAVLQSGSGVAVQALGPLVTAFSTLAIVTSMTGFTYGLVDAWADVLKLDGAAAKEQWKLPLFGLIFLPPLALTVADPDIFISALEYAGAFGVSTLFLVLPPLMVWNERYGDNKPDLMTTPMVPFGKIPLGSMWKAAGTLILEQGAEKLGVFDAIHSLIS